MTLTEIYKIIDESDCYWLKRGDWKLLCTLNHEWTKLDLKRQVMCTIENGYSFAFMKLKDNGEVESRWLVDHIDKEKKIVKKKLDDMTKEELIKLAKLYCKDRFNCDGCPLHAEKLSSCLTDYVSWKEAVKEYKDKEFEVEIEVEDEKEN